MNCDQDLLRIWLKGFRFKFEIGFSLSLVLSLSSLSQNMSSGSNDWSVDNAVPARGGVDAGDRGP